MRYASKKKFLRSLRTAPYETKVEFIKRMVEGKTVMDIGCVDHTLERCVASDQWLHHAICQKAKSVLGVDILAHEVGELNRRGYHMIAADATTLRLNEKFEVIVCGDIIEHMTNTGALLATVAYHLKDDGVCVITTPNPFAADRFFNVMLDGWTGVNQEHTCWYCPQTIYQLAERCGLTVDDFRWIKTSFPAPTRNFLFGWLANFVGWLLVKEYPQTHLDYGVVLRKKLVQDKQAVK